jgi:hypothetical protein
MSCILLCALVSRYTDSMELILELLNSELQGSLQNCGPSIWNLHHVTLQAPIILKVAPTFLENS